MKFAKKAAKILAFICLPLLILLAAGLFLLRTPAAENFIAQKIIQSLEGSGLTLTLGSFSLAEFSGPLPERLLVTDVTLADTEGPLISLKQAELTVNLWSLLLGTVEVERLLLDAPTLYRLPAAAPPDQLGQPVQAASANSSGLPFLGIDPHIRLGELRISEGLIHPEAFLEQPDSRNGQSGPEQAAAAQPVGTQPDKATPPVLAQPPKVDTPNVLPPLHVNLTGQAELVDGRLTAAVKASALTESSKGLELQLAITQSSGTGAREEELALDLSLREEADGLLAALLNQPGLPAYSVHLSGEGGLRNWQGVLRAAAWDKKSQALKGLDARPLAGFDFSAPDANLEALTSLPALWSGKPGQGDNSRELYRLGATLGLACNNGELWTDLLVKPGWRVTFAGRGLLSDKAPASARAALGNFVNAQADVAASGRAYSGRVDLKSALWQAGLNDLSVKLGPAGSADAFALRGKLEGKVPEVAAFAPKGTKPSLAAAGISANLDIALHASAAAGTPAGGAIGRPGGASFKLAGALSLRPRALPQDYALNYNLNAEQSGSEFKLAELTLEGLGLNSKASGRMDMASGETEAQLILDAVDREAWQDLAEALFWPQDASGRAAGGAATLPSALPEGQGAAPDATPGVKADGLGGSLHLTAEAHLPATRQPAKDIVEAAPAAPLPDDSPLDYGRWQKIEEEEKRAKAITSPTIKLNMQGSGLRWPDPNLEHLLGPELALHLELEEQKQAEPGGLPGNEVQGSSLSGGAIYVFSLKELKAKGLSGQGQASYLAAKPLVPVEPVPDAGPDGPAGSALVFNPDDRVEADFAFSLEDTAVLQAGFSGKLNVLFKASGPLNAMHSVVRLDSPRMQSSSGLFEGNLLELATDLRQDQSGLWNIQGKLNGKVGASPGGPLDLSAMAQAVFSSDQGKSALRRLVVENIDLQGAGLSLSGSLQGQSAGAVPLFDGQLRLALEDWAGLRAITGAPLYGGPAQLEARLESLQGRQDITADLEFSRVALGAGPNDANEAGTGASVFVNNLNGKIALKNILAAPEADFNLKVGEGQADLLHWQNGNISLKGDMERGALLLKLQDRSGQPLDKGSLASKGQNGKPGKNAVFTRAALNASYDLPKGIVQLDACSLNLPERETGFELAAPAVARVNASGIKLENMRLDFTPGGQLQAGGSFGSGKYDVAADLHDLPVRFFRMFTDAPLPGGAINLKLRAENKGRKLDGDFDLNAVLDAGRSGEPPLLLHLRGDLGPTPAAGSNLSARSGITWLRGQGAFGPGAPVAAGAKAASIAAVGGGMTQPSAAQKVPVTVEQAKDFPQNLGGSLSFSLPLRLQPNGLPLMDSSGQFQAGLLWEGPVDPLWQIVPMPDRFLSGLARMRVESGGTLLKPQTLAELFLADGKYEDKVLGVLVRAITLEARSTPNQPLSIALAAADAQGGTLALEGYLSAAPSAASAGASAGPRLALRGQINHLQPLQRDDVSVMLSGIFGVDGPVEAPAITADISVERGELQLLSGMGASVRTLELSEEAEEATADNSSAGPTCAINIDMPGQFFIRGMGLESEWQGGLKLNGPLKKVALTGSLKPVRGYFDIFSKSFEFTGGEITFLGGNKINPGINLELTYKRPDLSAIITAGGTAQKPSLSLHSRPAVPQDEVLSQVLFGKNVSSLSRFELLQLANGMRELATMGKDGLNPLTNMRKTLGLDVLRIGSTGDEGGEQSAALESMGGAGGLAPGQRRTDSSDAAPTLEAGKYISDSIYVGVEQGATSDSTGVRVEVELMPNISLEGRSSSTSSEVGIGWKKDY